jgi:hypothetical protein
MHSEKEMQIKILMKGTEQRVVSMTFELVRLLRNQLKKSISRPFSRRGSAYHAQPMSAPR